jgi:hypothetical protein
MSLRSESRRESERNPSFYLVKLKMARSSDVIGPHRQDALSYTSEHYFAMDDRGTTELMKVRKSPLTDN